MTMPLNRTHDGARRSWVSSANLESPFPIQNLPFGIFRPAGEHGSPRAGIAIGDAILDLSACTTCLTGLARQAGEAGAASDLNGLMALGRQAWSELRLQVSDLLCTENAQGKAMLTPHLVPMAGAELFLPARIYNFSDFFASINHALNAGRMFRPDEPLFPNYRHVPIAYNGRTSSIVVSGTPIRRPSGQILRKGEDEPAYAPSAQLDYEVELGVYIGTGSELGVPVAIEDAWDHLFGICLLNDWSARDIQAWEYRPLGPFLGKSFGTSVSPWIVTAEALMPFRVAATVRPDGDPKPQPYLHSEVDQCNGALDIVVECSLRSARMRDGVRVSRVSASDLYWTPAQFIAHHTSNGCNLEIGDLLGSGTISGTTPDSLGSLLELTARGSKPLDLNGEARGFLADGDEVTLTGHCQRDGFASIGFGACSGRIEPVLVASTTDRTSISRNG